MSIQISFTTTITHTVTVGDDGIEGAEHAVDIDASSATGLPEAAIIATVIGGCRSVLTSLDAEASR